MSFIITRTPFRLSLFGGGTDFPDFFNQFGALVVGGSINRYAYVLCRRLPPFFDYKSRVSYSKIECVNDNVHIQHKGVQAALDVMKIEDGLEITHCSDLPGGGTGIGSSSTFLVGLLNALNVLKHGHEMNRRLLVDLTNYIERELLQEPGGYQDAIWAAYGGTHAIQFDNQNEFHLSPLVHPSHLSSWLMLFYTGIQRASGEITKSYQNTLSQQKVISQLAHAGLAAIKSGDMIRVGELLETSWLQKKSLSNKVTNAVIEEMYDTARNNGAIGGKIIGSGGGGFLLLVVPPHKHDRVKEALSGYLQVDFTFEHSGSQVLQRGV